MRIPEYLTTEDITIRLGSNQTQVLPANSFVKPIDFGYLPKHIKESESGRYFNKFTQVFCYTHFGITVIDRNKIREV